MDRPSGRARSAHQLTIRGREDNPPLGRTSRSITGRGASCGYPGYPRGRASVGLAALLLLLAACSAQPTGGDSSQAEGSQADSGQAEGSQAEGGSGELVVGTFGGQYQEAVELGFVDAFEEETGIEVTLLPTVDAARSIAAIDAGSPPPEDIIPTIPVLADIHSAGGYLAPIDYELFDQETLDQLPESVRQEYTIGHGIFAIALCYDTNAFPEGQPQPQTWVDFWDLERFPGPRAMEDWTSTPQPELPILAAGTPVDELYPLDLDLAMSKMSEIKPELQISPSSVGPVQQLVDGQAVMAACYTHRLQSIIDAGLDSFAISWDQARLLTQTFSVWESAPNRENAMRFLAYMARVQPQAAWAQISNGSPVNSAAYEIIPDEQESLLPTAPAHDSVFHYSDEWYGETQEDSTSNVGLVFERWAEF